MFPHWQPIFDLPQTHTSTSACAQALVLPVDQHKCTDPPVKHA